MERDDEHGGTYTHTADPQGHQETGGTLRELKFSCKKKQKPVTVLKGLILFMMNLVLILVHRRHKTFIFKLLKIDLLKKSKDKIYNWLLLCFILILFARQYTNCIKVKMTWLRI